MDFALKPTIIKELCPNAKASYDPKQHSNFGFIAEVLVGDTYASIEHVSNGATCVSSPSPA